MAKTQSPLCLEKELRPPERIPTNADKTSGCLPNLSPWLESFLLALFKRKQRPLFLGNFLRCCSPRSGRSGRQQLSPNTACETTPRRDSCVPDHETLGEGGGRGVLSLWSCACLAQPAMNFKRARDTATGAGAEKSGQGLPEGWPPRQVALRQHRASPRAAGDSLSPPPGRLRELLWDRDNGMGKTLTGKSQNKSNLPWRRRDAPSAACRAQI